MRLNTFIQVRRIRHPRGFTLAEVVVSLAITGLLISALVSGYYITSRRAEWSGLSVAATEWASRRIEQVRGARWDVNAYPAVDELTVANFPKLVAPLNTVARGTNSGVLATNTVYFQTVSATPPVRMIKVECVWRFVSGILQTNLMVIYRTPEP